MYKAKFDVYDKKSGKVIERITVRNEYDFDKVKSRLREEEKKGKITWDYDKC